MRRKRKINPIVLSGVLLVIINVILNPLIVKYLLDRYLKLNILFYLLLFAINIFWIYIGIYMIRNPRKIREKLPYVYLSLITIIIGVVAMNFILGFYETIVINEIETEPSKKYHHMYKANDSGYRLQSKRDGIGNILIETNDMGMRGNTIPSKKDEKRLLILGDSFVQADEIEYTKTVGEILQSKVNASHYLVMQHGFSSWSPLLELNFLIKTYDALEPNHVVLVLSINDFYDLDVYTSSDVYYEKQTVFDASGYPLSFNIDMDFSMYREFPLVRYTYNALGTIFETRGNEKEFITSEKINFIFNLTKTEYNKTIIKRELNDLPLVENIVRLGRPSSRWDEDTRQRVDLSLNYIDLMNTYLKERNSSLTILLTPVGWNIAKDETNLGKQSPVFYLLNEDVIISDIGIRTYIENYAISKNITYIEIIHVMKRFKNKYPNSKLFFPMDGHWTEVSHKLLAEYLYFQSSYFNKSE